MPVTKSNQQLRRDPKEAAALLIWAGVDLFSVTRRMLAAGDERDAIELIKIARNLQADDNLAGYTDDRWDKRS